MRGTWCSSLGRTSTRSSRTTAPTSRSFRRSTSTSATTASPSIACCASPISPSSLEGRTFACSSNAPREDDVLFGIIWIPAVRILKYAYLNRPGEQFSPRYKLCFCDASLVGGKCESEADYSVEVGTIHASGVSCLIQRPELQRVRSADFFTARRSLRSGAAVVSAPSANALHCSDTVFWWCSMHMHSHTREETSRMFK